jgi:hypothetical protein
MTLSQNVEDALKLMDGCISTLPKGNKRDWQTIRAHLLSQDAEIERYKVAWTEYNDRTEWVQKTAKPKELGLHRADVLRLRIESAESRLAAADALLRECRRMAARLLPTPHDLYEQIDAFLQKAAQQANQ